MKYKIYIVKQVYEINEQQTIMEADFNIGCGFDSIEEAMESIQRNGSDYTNYTILPYIYLT